MWSLGLDYTIAINYLIVAHDIKKNYGLVYKWGRRLLGKRIPFSNPAYRAFLLNCLKKRKFEEAIDFVAQCKYHGQIPPIRIQNHLLDIYIENHSRFEYLLGLFGNSDWNTERYRILVLFYAKRGEVDKAWKIWQDYVDYFEYHKKNRPNRAVIKAAQEICGKKLEFANNVDRIISQYSIDRI
jgi:hypothetical protein